MNPKCILMLMLSVLISGCSLVPFNPSTSHNSTDESMDYTGLPVSEWVIRESGLLMLGRETWKNCICEEERTGSLVVVRLRVPLTDDAYMELTHHYFFDFWTLGEPPDDVWAGTVFFDWPSKKSIWPAKDDTIRRYIYLSNGGSRRLYLVVETPERERWLYYCRIVVR